MTTDRRLDAVTTALTARERARLANRWWAADEEPDRRLVKHMPPEQTEEFNRLVQAVIDANSSFHRDITFATEWTLETEVKVGWCITLDALLARCDVLTRALAERGVEVIEGDSNQPHEHHVLIVRPLPPVEPWFPGEELPRIWGGVLRQDEPDPTGWAEARDRLARTVHTDINVRWRELESMDMVFADLALEFGEPMIHAELTKAADRLREKLRQLHGLAQAVTGSFELEVPTVTDLETANNRIPWDRIRPGGVNGTPANRPPMWAAERAELEAAEAEWAESLQ